MVGCSGGNMVEMAHGQEVMDSIPTTCKLFLGRTLCSKICLVFAHSETLAIFLKQAYISFKIRQEIDVRGLI